MNSACRVPRMLRRRWLVAIGCERAWHGGIGLAGTRSLGRLACRPVGPGLPRQRHDRRNRLFGPDRIGRHRSVRRAAARTARPLRRPPHRHHRRTRADAGCPAAGRFADRGRRTVERGCRHAGLPLGPMRRTAMDAEMALGPASMRAVLDSASPALRRTHLRPRSLRRLWRLPCIAEPGTGDTAGPIDSVIARRP